MKRGLVFVLIVGFIGVVHASDNSIEVTLEDTPQDHQAFKSWRHKPTNPQNVDSDASYALWRYKFEGASDKQLGSPADTAAIKALVPRTIPPTIRWVSRSIVVVASVCRSEASSSRPGRCLYVFEKHDSKWRLIHHYRWSPPVF